ncbi:hypothetical protein Tco_0925138 [Tanacetum coccineum]|uniref:Uncharacterized protein n=1 Tax=Tanacetum coccineum TaxID=301880 RepID=A0ABQ5DCZ4_9ASTR
MESVNELFIRVTFNSLFSASLNDIIFYAFVFLGCAPTSVCESFQQSFQSLFWKRWETVLGLCRSPPQHALLLPAVCLMGYLISVCRGRLKPLANCFSAFVSIKQDTLGSESNSLQFSLSWIQFAGRAEKKFFWNSSSIRSSVQPT